MRPLDFICLTIPAAPAPQSLLLPGGISLESINLMEMVQPALTPLVPLFNIVDAIVAVFNAIQAIPDMIGPPPDPTVLGPALAELANRVAVLLGIIPPLSIPATVVGLLDLAIDTLRAVRTELLHLQSQAIQIAGVMDRAAALEDDGLLLIALCGQGHIEQEAANVGAGLASLGRVLGIVSLFMGMIGGPMVPDLSSLAGVSLAGVIAPIDALVEALQAARAAVSIP